MEKENNRTVLSTIEDELIRTLIEEHDPIEWRQLGKEGIVLFSLPYFYKEDQEQHSVDFVNETLDSFDENSNIFEIAMAETATYGIDAEGPFFTYGNIICRSGDQDHPVWAIMRTRDWKMAYHLEKMGVVCFPSSSTLRITSDKALSASLVSTTSVSMPNTILQLPISKINTTFSDYPIIIKSSNSNGGKGVCKAENLLGVLSARERIREDMIYQESMPTGDDLRVYCVCGKVVAAIKREQGKDDFRANKKYGGKRSLVTLSDSDRDKVLEILSKFDDPITTGYISCDFLFDHNGELVFCELNPCPGINLLTPYMEDFVEEYIAAVRNCCQK